MPIFISSPSSHHSAVRLLSAVLAHRGRCIDRPEHPGLRRNELELPQQFRVFSVRDVRVENVSRNLAPGRVCRDETAARRSLAAGTASAAVTGSAAQALE